MLIGLTHALNEARVDALGHAVKVDEQAKKDFVGGGTILVDAGEVAEDGDCGNILAVEGEDASRLRAEARCALGRGDLAMQVLMLPVVGGGDFGQQACHHLYYVGDGHFANLVLRPDVTGILTSPPGRTCLREGTRLIIGKTLNVGKALDFYSVGRWQRGPGNGLEGLRRGLDGGGAGIGDGRLCEGGGAAGTRLDGCLFIGLRVEARAGRGLRRRMGKARALGRQFRASGRGAMLVLREMVGCSRRCRSVWNDVGHRRVEGLRGAGQGG